MVRIDMIIDDNKIEFFFSELGHFKVVDANRHNLGIPGDALLSLEDFSLNSLILFRGHLEGKLEEIIHKEINEYIVPMSSIKAIDPTNKVFLLNVAKEELKQTSKDFNVPAQTIEFLKLKKLPVYSKSNEKLGRIVDIYYPIGDTCKFVVAGSELEEFFIKLRIVPNHDLLVPEQLINNLLDKIQISVDKNELIDVVAEVNSTKNPLDNLRFGGVHVIPKSIFSYYSTGENNDSIGQKGQLFSILDRNQFTEKRGYYEK